MFTVLSIGEPIKERHSPHAGVSEFYKQHIHSGKYPVGILREEMFFYKSDCFPLGGLKLRILQILI